MKKKNFLIIIPFIYLERKNIEGHQKDINFLAEYLKSNNYLVDLLYTKNFKLFKKDGSKLNFSIFKLLKKDKYCHYKIILSPLHRLRLEFLILKKIKPIIYLYDSILKTSLFAFIKKPIYFHRVVYGYLIEKLLLDHKIFIVSLEEHSWLTSQGHHQDNLFILPPPLIDHRCHLVEHKPKTFRILFYEPNKNSLKFTKNLITDLLNENLNLKISIKSRNKLIEGNSFEHYGYAEDMGYIISKNDLIVITDIGGSGSCNRALQVRYLGKPLLSTFDGIRGTNLIYDKNVFIFKNEIEFIKILKGKIDKFKSLRSNIIFQNYNLYQSEVKRFIDICFKS